MPTISQSQAPSNRSVKSPIQPCPTKHWIVVKLIRLPDKKPRRDLTVQNVAWWPARQREAYGSESFSAEITNGHKNGSLNGAGMVRFDGIPAGSCQFLFNKFYDEIDKFFSKRLK